MDATGNFSNSADTGIEAPANIGTDERRMHVRAYNYWVSLLGGRAYPSIEDLEPENLEDFGPNSVLLDFTSGVDNPTITFLGPKLRRACGLPHGVTEVMEIPSRSLLSRLTDHYMQIIANRAPIGFEAEFVDDAGMEIMYRGILMPFSSDDDTIDFIYGVINWKEAAEVELQDALASEVEQVLGEAPAPRHEPSAATWADGPMAAAVPSFSEAAVDPEAELHDEVLELGSFAEASPPSEPAILPDFTPDGSESLADWLAAARDSADAVGDADLRSRVALYRALGQAYDFALVAEARPEEYQELLSDAGLVGQERAPMTPIVKLVFGSGYDKTRLAEYALALTHGRKSAIDQGRFQGFVETYLGGLKGIIQAERASRRSTTRVAKDDRLIERASNINPKGIVEMQGSEDFVMLIARRIDGEHVAVLGQVATNDKSVEKALRKLLN